MVEGFRHFVSFVALTPLFFGLVGMLLGFVLWPIKRRLGIALVGFFFVLLWSFSTPLFPSLMLRGLQKGYPPVPVLEEQVDYLAVLGSWHSPDARLSPLLRLDGAAAQRLLKGVALLEDQKTAKLWLGGQAAANRTSHVDILKLAALQLGVAEGRIQPGGAPNTRAEMRALKRGTPAGANIAIISSAFHLKRVALWARHYGLYPLYVPVDTRSTNLQLSIWELVVPRATYLNDSSLAWHEYLGLVHAQMLIVTEDLFGT